MTSEPIHVSVSAYQDAGLLENCLAAIRDELPEATISVVDGKYETWPGGPDNSTDGTEAVAAAYDAVYDPAGPFPRECDKHQYRTEQIPNDEWLLCMDADERLRHFDRGVLDNRNAWMPRIVNALVYHDGSPVAYWPRLFKPGWVSDIQRWDKYRFSIPDVDPTEVCQRTDRVTIVHRHDLRERSYREAKYERMEANEGRTPRYDETRETYYSNSFDVETETCPNCGADSVTRTPITDYADAYSMVTVCTNSDGCFASIDRIPFDGEYEYLPDEWREGFRADPARLRLELLDAGCSFVRPLSMRAFERMGPAVGLWIDENM